MTKTKTILLTGGTGFLGSNLLKKLTYENYQVILLTRSSSVTDRITNILGDIVIYNTDEISLDKIFQYHHIDVILHCATSYGRKMFSPLHILECNLFLPLKLFELGGKYGTSCFINTDTILNKRINNYSLSKSQFRDWLIIYSKSLVCINVSLEHFYGPYDDETKFVTYIVRSIISSIDSIDLTLGRQKRDFIYIDDVVDAFVLIVNQSANLGVGYYNFEIGTSRSTEIRQFVTLVKHIANNSHTKLNFGALPYRQDETMDINIDSTEIMKLGWEPKFTTEEGLKKTICLEKENLIT